MEPAVDCVDRTHSRQNQLTTPVSLEGTADLYLSHLKLKVFALNLGLLQMLNFTV